MIQEVKMDKTKGGDGVVVLELRGSKSSSRLLFILRCLIDIQREALSSSLVDMGVEAEGFWVEMVWIYTPGT